MVRRYVFCRFKEAYREDEALREIVSRTEAVLQDVPEVLDFEIGMPADDASLAAWDLSISAAFSTLDELELYIANPLYRRYVDEFITPRLEVLKAWNFMPKAETE